MGVRQAEDDLVTLLRKAEFRTIAFSAVEGYAPEDEVSEVGPPAAAAASRRPGSTPPCRSLPPPGPIAYAARPGGSAGRAPRRGVARGAGAVRGRLAAELVAWAARGAIPAGEAAQFCAELRDFLVADQQLATLAHLADLAQRQPAGPLRDEILRGLADPRLLDAVLGVLPAGGGDLPPEAARLVPFVPAAAVMERIAAEESPGRRSALLAVVAARLPADAEAVAARLPALPVEPVRPLLRLLSQKAPDRADETSLALLGHADPGLQLEALRALQGASRRVAPAALVKLLEPRPTRRSGSRRPRRSSSTATAPRPGRSRSCSAAARG